MIDPDFRGGDGARGRKRFKLRGKKKSSHSKTREKNEVKIQRNSRIKT
jgi:hypothetical protein